MVAKEIMEEIFIAGVRYSLYSADLAEQKLLGLAGKPLLPLITGSPHQRRQIKAVCLGTIKEIENQREIEKNRLLTSLRKL